MRSDAIRQPRGPTPIPITITPARPRGIRPPVVARRPAHGEIQLKKCAEYVGIEMFESEGAKAKNLLSEVHIGNVETMALPYPSDYFDVLIASEVLEHLVDPYETVRRLCTLVKPGGRILASSPNISWFGNIVGLIKGKFEYEEEGMMDRTHLRWFTPASYAGMFVEAGVRVDLLAPLAAVTGKNARRKRWISYVFGNRFDHIWWYQINFHGTRIAPVASHRSDAVI